METRMTLLEALRLYPDLFDEEVDIVLYEEGKYPKKVVFQFCGDEYRTRQINRPIIPKE